MRDCVHSCSICEERAILSWRTFRGRDQWVCAACVSADDYPELSAGDIDAMFEEDARG